MKVTQSAIALARLIEASGNADKIDALIGTLLEGCIGHAEQNAPPELPADTDALVSISLMCEYIQEEMQA